MSRIRLPHALKCALLLAVLPLSAWPAAPGCRVSDIVDAETVRLSCGGEPEREVRLAGIQAPSLRALFHSRASRRLAQWVHNRQVTVEPVEDLSRVLLFVKGHSVNAALVSEGLARCTSDAAWCRTAQEQARVDGRGVWSDPWVPVRHEGREHHERGVRGL
jgi:endonuclease YncB( thermonuclease family)